MSSSEIHEILQILLNLYKFLCIPMNSLEQLCPRNMNFRNFNEQGIIIRIHVNSQKLVRIQKKSYSRSCISQEFIGCTGIPGNSQKFLAIPRNFQEFLGIHMNSWKFYIFSVIHRIQKHSQKFIHMYKNSQESQEFIQIHRNSQNLKGIHRNSQEFKGRNKYSKENRRKQLFI